MTDQTTPTPAAPKPEQKKEKKPGIFKRFGKYLRDTRSEVKKVVWPSRQQTVNNTVVVIVCIVIVGAFIGALDFGLARGLKFLLGLAAGV